MDHVPIYTPKNNEKMRVACFVSGSGTNARKIIERSRKSDSRYSVELIFTDVKDDRLYKSGKKRCMAKDIAVEYGISYECEDIRDFYKSKGHKTRRDLSLRPEFDGLVLEKTSNYEIDIVALAGYMSVTTEPLLEAFNGRMINVHPADLSIMEGEERKYVGMHAVRDAILSGERELRATTHVVREKVDYGEILIISEPLPVTIPDNTDLKLLEKEKEILNRIVSQHQNELKEFGDWIIYPLTLQMIAEGRFALNGCENVYFNGKKTECGHKL